MKYRFLISKEHRRPEELSPTMLLGLPQNTDYGDFVTASHGPNVSRFEFTLPDDVPTLFAQKIGLGFAFGQGFYAGVTVSRLFFLKHSTETEIGKRSTDWTPAF